MLQRQHVSLSDGQLAHIAVQRVHRFGLSQRTVECDNCHDTFDADWMIVRWGRRMLCAWCVHATEKARNTR